MAILPDVINYDYVKIDVIYLDVIRVCCSPHNTV